LLREEDLVMREVLVEALERAIGAAHRKMTTNLNKMLEKDNVQLQEKKRFLKVQEVALSARGAQGESHRGRGGPGW
jgi:hypothetical protein